MNDDELQKIKFHIGLLSQAIDVSAHPIEALVLSMDWSETELELAHDIFEAFEEELSTHGKADYRAFERQLTEKLGLSYQALKGVVLAFYRNSQWVDACVAYAEAAPCAEFNEILRDKKGTNTSLDATVEKLLVHAGVVVRKNALLAGENQKLFVDFLCEIRGRRIAIETKQGRFSEMRAVAAAKWAATLLSTGKMEEVWLITTKSLSEEEMSFFALTNVRLMSITELIENLR